MVDLQDTFPFHEEIGQILDGYYRLRIGGKVKYELTGKIQYLIRKAIAQERNRCRIILLNAADKIHEPK